jgi:hypothetical protein
MADVLGQLPRKRAGIIIGAPRLDANGNPMPNIPTPAAPTGVMRGSLGSNGMPATNGLPPPLANTAPPDPFFSAVEQAAIDSKTAKKNRQTGLDGNITGGGSGLLGAGGSIYRRSLLGLS